MAFTVTNLSAIGWDCSEALTSKFFQNVEIVGTAAGADVVLDLGSPSGTFWTSVANVPIKNAFFDCYTHAQNLISMHCSSIEDVRTQVGSAATLAAGQYKKITTITSAFGYTLFAGEGVTTFRISIVFNGKPDMLPVQCVVTP